MQSWLFEGLASGLRVPTPPVSPLARQNSRHALPALIPNPFLEGLDLGILGHDHCGFQWSRVHGSAISSCIPSSQLRTSLKAMKLSPMSLYIDQNQGLFVQSFGSSPSVGEGEPELSEGQMWRCVEMSYTYDRVLFLPSRSRFCSL